MSYSALGTGSCEGSGRESNVINERESKDCHINVSSLKGGHTEAYEDLQAGSDMY